MSQSNSAIRPFDPFRDLGSVVDLIDVAFGDRLDPAGQATLSRMRRFARAGGFLQWLWALLGKVTVAPGLVWVEDGRVVGNVSLRRAHSRRGYLIGNVVVHPEWRGQGIATALMQAAIKAVSQRGGYWIGLEVRADNDVACRLYDRLGFREVGRTLYMLHTGGASWERGSGHESIRRAGRRDSDALVDLMHAAIPEEQRPLLEVRESDYQPGWKRSLEHWLKRRREDWWVAEGDEKLRGAVRALRRQGSPPNELEILVRPGEEGFEAVLVKRGMASLRGSPGRQVLVRLPVAKGPLVAALEAEGFRRMFVLVQMKRTLTHRIPVMMGGRGGHD